MERSELAKKAREHDWLVGTGAALLAMAALVGGSEFGKFQGAALHQEIIGWSAAVVLLVTGVIATRRLASGLDSLITRRSIRCV